MTDEESQELWGQTAWRVDGMNARPSLIQPPTRDVVLEEIIEAFPEALRKLGPGESLAIRHNEPGDIALFTVSWTSRRDPQKREDGS